MSRAIYAIFRVMNLRTFISDRHEKLNILIIFNIIDGKCIKSAKEIFVE